MIEIRGVSHGFHRGRNNSGHLNVLEEITFTIQEGSIVSLLGPSGCGKTTLLRIIDGLVTPLSGEVRIDGDVVKRPSADKAMVFQEFNLLPWRTARRNIEFAGELQGLTRKERSRRSEIALQQVGLSKFANYYPHQLSGGMKQRVGLARALCTNPKYLLMDEPFGALDPQIREVMQVEMLKLLEAEGKTIVLVTHSIDEAIFLSDQVVVLSANPGRILTVLDIDLQRPRWSRDEEIKASASFVDYRVKLWRLLKQQIRVNSDPILGS